DLLGHGLDGLPRFGLERDLPGLPGRGDGGLGVLRRPRPGDHGHLERRAEHEGVRHGADVVDVLVHRVRALVVEPRGGLQDRSCAAAAELGPAVVLAVRHAEHEARTFGGGRGHNAPPERSRCALPRQESEHVRLRTFVVANVSPHRSHSRSWTLRTVARTSSTVRPCSAAYRAAPRSMSWRVTGVWSAMEVLLSLLGGHACMAEAVEQDALLPAAHAAGDGRVHDAPPFAISSSTSAWHGWSSGHQHARSRPASSARIWSTSGVNAARYRATAMCGVIANSRTYSPPRVGVCVMRAMPTCHGLPHFDGRATTTAPSGFRHPFVRRGWIRFGARIAAPPAPRTRRSRARATPCPCARPARRPRTGRPSRS